MDDPSAALAGRHRRQGVFLSLELGLADWFASGELILSDWSSERCALRTLTAFAFTPGALGWRGFRALASCSILPFGFQDLVQAAALGCCPTMIPLLFRRDYPNLPRLLGFPYDQMNVTEPFGH